MNQSNQDLYAATRMNLLSMLKEIADKAEDAVNPEDATYSDLSDLMRLESEIKAVYNRVTETGEYASA